MKKYNYDEKHAEYLELLDIEDSELFDGLNLKKILYNDAYYCLSVPFCASIKLLIYRLFFVSCVIKKEIECNDILAVYTHNYRMDHDSYWQAICDDLENHDSITFYVNEEECKKMVSPVVAIKRLQWFYKAFRKLKFIKSFSHRCYLSAELVSRKSVFEEIKLLDLAPKVVMCFFDSAPYESVIMQYYKKKGAITVTNQHGQLVFRNSDSERVAQSQFLNFMCDYYLAKGEFQREQFRKARGNDINVIMVGDINNKSKLELHSQKNIFTVLLDSPDLTFYKETNSILINSALDFSLLTNYYYYIKVHPNDICDYCEMIGEESHCLGIVKREKTLNELFAESDFCINHSSAAYIDSYNAGVRCFKVVTKYNWPIAYEDDEVIDAGELRCKLNIWNELSEKERKEYIGKVRKKYDSGWKDGNIRKVIKFIIENRGLENESSIIDTK